MESVDVLDPYVSRFFVKQDRCTSRLIYELPSPWWSRPYEYEWSRSFIHERDCVLDAACGMPHPFKFYLAQYCAQVYACDMDPRITSTEAILEEIRLDIGEEAYQLIQQVERQHLHLGQENIAALSYPNEYFDKIYCISVLEHLNPPDQRCAMKEFYRTLKEEGLLLITLDYPTVDLVQFHQICHDSGFRFWQEPNFKLPVEALYTELYGGLYCFRAVLVK